MIRALFIAALLALGSASQALAATCYWVAGTSYNSSASWASSTGGSGGTCAATSGIPKNAGDVAFLDANSPAATTLLIDTDITLATIEMRALSGSSGLDGNGHNVTLSTGMLVNGTGTRSLTLGSGTWTLQNGGTWNMITTTGLTFSGASAPLVFGGGASTAAISFFGGGKTYGPVTILSSSTAQQVQIEPGNNASNTFASLTISGPINLNIRESTTQTFTGGITGTGSSSGLILISSGSGSAVTTTLSVGAASTCDWCAFRAVTGSGSAITATNSFSLGNTGGTLSISAPTGGGSSGYIIGG